ncbi:MAG TPA: DUF934 domain-containing protein [Burkholderiales bacterium]|nr:DUF934 domain-containing protein [Burkholderiales bacterium]
MPKIILDNRVVEDDWTLVQYPVKNEPVRKQAGKPVLFKITGEAAASAEEIAALVIPAGKIIVPLSAWLARKEQLSARLDEGKLAVWLDSFELLEALVASVDSLNRFPLIAINFPRFVDGRGYSVASLLRSRYRYTGQIRAIGDVLHDQLFYMKRCGFDAYAVRADRNIEDALRGLKDFSEPYQAHVDQAQPLYRRHARQPA